MARRLHTQHYVMANDKYDRELDEQLRREHELESRLSSRNEF